MDSKFFLAALIVGLAALMFMPLHIRKGMRVYGQGIPEGAVIDEVHNGFFTITIPVVRQWGAPEASGRP